jgi:quercetin dioxygenase-like cupin family protein
LRLGNHAATIYLWPGIARKGSFSTTIAQAASVVFQHFHPFLQEQKMRMNKALLFAALSLISVSASAVDAVTACPKNFHVLAEDDKARVLHFTQKKGETCPMHSHPHIAVYVTKPGAPLVYKMADGSVKEGPKLKAGDAFVRPATEHEHLASKGDVEAIIVEFKK